MLKIAEMPHKTEREEIYNYLHPNERLTDLSGHIRINIPQAVIDFEPPLFYPTEKWKKGSRTGFMDLKNAFNCLYRTLICNGYAVNLCDSDEAQIVINWSGKRQFSNDKDRQLYFEHGWIPRWSYQISDRGTNSRSHVAHGYKHTVLSEQKNLYVLEYCRNMRDIFEINVDKDKLVNFKNLIKGPFVLFPFQLATDFNLRYSNSFFSEYYSRDAKANITFAQACVDFVEESAISLPVVFKQHPGDRNDLRTHLKIRNKRNILLCNDYIISTNEVFYSGLCKLVISINSNTIHEAAVWNIPSVALGTLLWNESNEPRPFPKDVSTLDNLVNGAFFDSDIRVSYLFHVIRNQWYLNDFLNPLIVRELVNSRGRCIPYDLRNKLGLEQCVCHISQRATVVAEPRDHLPHTDIRSAATKNWAFDSGERQTAGRLEDIRKDHLNRYQYVADFIKSTSSDTGTIGVLDVFCGNGYGSFLFTNEIEGVVVDAIDGSAEAIEFAKQNFSSEKITYHNAIFPFSSTVPIRPEYDYIVSLESIEHVEDDRRFYEFLLSKLKDNGVLFLSFPNKHKIDLSRNTHLFHFRHYDLQNIESLIKRGSRRVKILQSYGQDVYVLDKDGCKRGLLNESDMVLKRNYEGQFLMVALRKLSRNQAGDERYVNLQKLDVGCGPKKPMPGFVGVDTRPFPWVKYVCDAWKIDKHVPPDSISEIYSRHFFEHLTFAQADLTLQAWERILVLGGMLQIIVPDIEYHIKQFLTPNSLTPSETNPKWTVLEHALAGFWGWQNEGEEKFWDVHKSGYDFRCLEMKLLQHGFSDIRRIDDKPWNLNVICKTKIAEADGRKRNMRKQFEP